MMARFCAYISKVFDLPAALATLQDDRERPQVCTMAVWSSVFALFATQRGSLHALEGELRIPKRLEALVGPRKPSADTIGRVFAGMDPQPLRALLAGIVRRLGRNKVLPSPWPLRFVVLDGHEFFSLPASLL